MCRPVSQVWLQMDGRIFLSLLGLGLQDLLSPDIPIISVSKGLELGTGSMMSEVIPQALGRRQPAAFLSGPSFAKEVMDKQPTGFVAASKVG
jgi:glycerol-3-phosphate dehydrogenase (NAD+)